jgi:hypothetical protein
MDYLILITLSSQNLGYACCPGIASDCRRGSPSPPSVQQYIDIPSSSSTSLSFPLITNFSTSTFSLQDHHFHFTQPNTNQLFTLHNVRQRW